MEPPGNLIRRGLWVQPQRDANERALQPIPKAAAAESIRRDGSGLDIFPSERDG